MGRVVSRWIAFLVVAGLGRVASAGSAPASPGGLPPLIPREVLFGNPERVQPKLSPDSKRLAWLAPDKNGVLQVWVKTIGGSDDKMVTADKKRGIRRYEWAQDDRTLLYMQDADGDENWHVYGVDLGSGPTAGAVRDFTPWQGVRAELEDVSQDFPDRILVTINLRDRRLFDVWRIDLKTGAAEIQAENPGDVAGWATDAKQVVRGAQVVLPDGGTEIRVRDGEGAAWRTLVKTTAEDEVDLIDFNEAGTSVYLLTSLGGDTKRVVERDLKTGTEKELSRENEVDAQALFAHPRRHVIQAVGYARGRLEWKVLDPSVKDDFAAIGKLFAGDFNVVNRDRADEHWLVGFTQDRGPIRYYEWDRKAKKGTFLFVHQPKLEGLQLAEMKFVTVPARDGLKLPAYLTLPVGMPAKKLPAVLLVHGGPWARDSWGFAGTPQWFSNRGYAVLQINFRGSTGFGKKFLHAGDRQWGKSMHNDLIDGVNWLVKEGIADPKRVAIFGGSYGGYSALAAAAFTPDVFRCSVDIVGPSSIFTLLKSIPPYWAPILGMFKARVGDPEKDNDLLKAASPLYSADKIKIPLLIGQGANDPRVKQAESEQIVAAIEKNGGQVTYVLYPDEGHGFARPENRIDFNARAEQFLAEHMGGRVEPMVGEKVPGSTAVVKVVGAAKAK